METNKNGSAQIMIIVWKWKWQKSSIEQKENRKTLTHVNEKTWSEEEFCGYISHIDSGEGIFYEEYEVEYSDLCPNARVVGASIYKNAKNDWNQDLLYALVDKYAVGEDKVMLFLHRSNFYTEEDVEKLLNHFGARVAKCFLFADGRDYIYYKTQKIGILNDTGGFQIGIDRTTGKKAVTFEDGKVKQPYFDRVWQYYDDEFENKVFNLKEELFDQWLRLLLPDQPDEIPRKTVLDAVCKTDPENNDKTLLFRLKSFMGLYHDELKKLHAQQDYDRIGELKEELKTLEKQEKISRVSYLFDDCIVNLRHQEKSNGKLIADAYEEIKDMLLKDLFERTNKTVTKKQLVTIASKFNYLIKVIPGELE